jgi:apolipoprotein N-acyltransferase
VLGNSLWILPLITFERITEGHYYQAGALGLTWIVALATAVKLHVVEEIASHRERRKQLLTWAVISSGAILLAYGVYRLASVPGLIAQPQIEQKAVAETTSSQAAVSLQSKHYFPDEKSQLGNLLSAISDRLNKEGLEAATRGETMTNMVASEDGQKSQAKAIMDRVDANRFLIITMSRAIWDEIIAKNKKYESELSEVVANGQDGNRRALFSPGSPLPARSRYKRKRRPEAPFHTTLTRL